MQTAKISQLIKEKLNFFTAYYSMLMALYFSVIAFPQFLKPAKDICLNNFSVSVSKAVAMDNYLFVFNFGRAIVISLSIVFPILSLWYLNGKTYRLLAEYESNFNRSIGDNLCNLIAGVALPLILWSMSCVATMILSLSVSSATGVVLWFILFQIPFFVIGPVIYKTITVPR